MLNHVNRLVDDKFVQARWDAWDKVEFVYGEDSYVIDMGRFDFVFKVGVEVVSTPSYYRDDEEETVGAKYFKDFPDSSTVWRLDLDEQCEIKSDGVTRGCYPDEDVEMLRIAIAAGIVDFEEVDDAIDRDVRDDNLEPSQADAIRVLVKFDCLELAA
jgi:hypothetical protein